MADGTPRAHDPVTQEVNVQMTIADAHRETLSLKVTKLKYHTIILGADWLCKHNPAINWKKHMVTFRDEHCNKHCVQQYPDPAPTLVLDHNLPYASTHVSTHVPAPVATTDSTIDQSLVNNPEDHEHPDHGPTYND
jgi:hypothetical protein